MDPERVLEADRILDEWTAEYSKVWESQGEDWYNDPDFGAHFALAFSLSLLAYDAALQENGLLETKLWRVCDRHMVG